MLLSLDNVGIQRSEKWLVRGVSMDINPGEIVTIIGPNGSGKSTTAKTALGIMTPDECRASKPNLNVSYVLKNLRSIDITQRSMLSSLTYQTSKTMVPH